MKLTLLISPIFTLLIMYGLYIWICDQTFTYIQPYTLIVNHYNIPIVASGLLSTSIRIVYFICLVGFTAENNFWSKGENVLKFSNRVLIIGGLTWLWRNIEINLICLVICLVILSTRDIRPLTLVVNRGIGGPTLQFEHNRWSAIPTALCLFQLIVGILWWSSHKNLLFYLALFVYTIILSTGEIEQHNTGINEKNRVIHPLIRIREGILVNSALFMRVISLMFLIFWGIHQGISDNFKTFCKSMYHIVVYLGSTTSLLLSHFSRVLNTNNTSLLQFLQGIIGQNVNHGAGTQTIGDITINITTGNYLIVLSLVGCLVLYMFSVGVITNETCSS